MSNEGFGQICIPTDSSCYGYEVFPAMNFEIEKLYDSNVNTNLYQTPLVGDIIGDCYPELIVSGTTNVVSNPRLTSGIHLIDPTNGIAIFSFATAYYAWSAPTSFCIGDVDSDGLSEIIIAAADHSVNPINVRGRLVCYNFDGTVKWISDANFGQNVTWKFITDGES